MSLETLALTFDFIGKILIALTALSVHHKISEEKKIDKHIIKKMRMEQKAGYLAILLIAVAYLIKLFIK